MNYNNYIFCIVISFLALSCSKDSDSPSLIGAYTYESLRVTNCLDPTDNFGFAFANNSECTRATNGLEVCQTGQLIIKLDNTFNSTIHVYSSGFPTTTIDRLNGSGTVSRSGNEINLCLTSGPCTSYTLIGNKLVFRGKNLISCDLEKVLRKNN